MLGELTSRLSSSWMYITYVSLLFDLFSPLCWWIDKKGEKDFESIYMHVLLFCLFIQKGEKNLVSLYMFISLFMHVYLFSFIHFIEYIYVYCYAWVKGELLWSLTLIHAYITPWVLSSTKRGRLLAQRPITLVLMMINSYSYSTNDLVFI